MVTYPDITVLTDDFLKEFNTNIVNALTWLNNPLGKIQAITKEVEGDRVQVPAMFVDGREYIELYPNDKLANMSWWDFAPIELTGSRPKARYSLGAKFNMFLDLRKIYPLEEDSRDLENAKLEVINALYNITLKTGSITPLAVSENYEDVYEGYALPDAQDRLFMQPYAGLSFEMDIMVRNNIC
jgi:hypothetical protein